MTFEELFAALRTIDGVRDKSNGAAPNLHFRSRAFLHFHGGPDGVHADIKLTDGWVKVPLDTDAQRAGLFEQASAYVAANRPRR